MTMSSFMDIVQKENEPIRAYIERFRQTALRLPPGIPEPILMDSCYKICFLQSDSGTMLLDARSGRHSLSVQIMLKEMPETHACYG